MSKRQSLAFSMEQFLDEVIVVDEPAAIPPPSTTADDGALLIESAETELMAVATAQQEAGDTVDAIGQLMAAADTLTGIRGNIEATLDNGGMSESEASMTQMAVNAVVAPLGLDNVIPSMENFGSSNERYESSRISMEAVGNVITSIGKRVGELIVKLIERVKTATKTAIAYLTKSLDQSKALVAKVKAATTNEFKVTLSESEASALAIDNRVGELTAASQMVLTAFNPAGPRFVSEVSGPGLRAIRDLLDTSNVDGFKPVIFPSATRREGDTYRSAKLPGNAVVKCTVGANPEYTIEYNDTGAGANMEHTFTKADLTSALGKIGEIMTVINAIDKAMPEPGAAATALTPSGTGGEVSTSAGDYASRYVNEYWSFITKMIHYLFDFRKAVYTVTVRALA